MRRQHIFIAFFFAAFFFLIYQLYLFLAPFAVSLFLAAVLVITVSPVTRRLLEALRGARNLTAVIMTVAVVLLVLVPLAILFSLLAAEASHFQDGIDAIRSQEGRSAVVEWFGDVWQRLVGWLPLLGRLDPSDLSLEASKRVAGWVAKEGEAFATGAVTRLLNAVTVPIALFFFFRDGDRVAASLRELIPMRPEYRDRIVGRLYDTLQVVVQSSLVIAVLQGIVAGLGYAFIGGIAVSVFLAFITGVASLIPVVGSALVWVPTVIYVLIADELWRGIGLFLWCALAVGSVDNIVRPLMIGGRVEMPTALLLFALLGGVQVYGMLGVLVAPVVVAILLGFVEIYRERLAELED